MKSKLLMCAVFLSLGLWIGSVAAQDDDESIPAITTRVLGETGEGVIYIISQPNLRPRDVLPADWPEEYFMMVIDNDGNRLFTRNVPAFSRNFRTLPDGTLAYYERVHGFQRTDPDARYVILNSEGEEIRSYQTVGDEVETDEHEILLLENGNVMLLGKAFSTMDMTEYGGHPEAIVLDVVIQELDPDGNLVWEWRGLDHFSFDEVFARRFLRREPPTFVDYVHANGLAVDLDGNVLLSSRNISEITKIDRETGEIIWRMGGTESVTNEFTFIDDPQNGFSFQHMPIVLENGNLLLYDNGNRHETPISRALEYEIDEEARTATLVWSYQDGGYYASRGSVQRLENGNTLIGWGTVPRDSDVPAVTEVNMDGEVVLELVIARSGYSYRAYRLPWYGE